MDTRIQFRGREGDEKRKERRPIGLIVNELFNLSFLHDIKVFESIRIQAFEIRFRTC